MYGVTDISNYGREIFLENLRLDLRVGLKMTSELNFRATCVIYDFKNKIDYAQCADHIFLKAKIKIILQIK